LKTSAFLDRAEMFSTFNLSLKDYKVVPSPIKRERLGTAASRFFLRFTS
jgi:hypothetical protein